VTDTSETLETGYGPHVPPGDNVCNDFVQESAASFAAFATARGDRVARVDGVVTMTDAGSPLPFFNRAILEAPAGDVDELLREIRRFYGMRSTPFLLDSAWPLGDLRPHGFALMGHPPLMLRPAGQPLPDPPADVRIVSVTDDTLAFDYEHALVYGYPAPQLQPHEDLSVITTAAREAPGWHHFVGYADDRAVAAGTAFVGDRLLRVDNIATLDEVRGRGFGRAITAATIAVDVSKPATLVASDLGRPVYERLGFVALLRMSYWIGLPG
jgi:GNAT superfamily N-acetyltransferase